VKEFEAPDVLEFLAQKIKHSPIFFYGQDFAGFFQKQLGQGPEAGADFQNFVRGTQPGRVHNPAELVLIVQEILAE
jgi:hypothetical protein